MPAYYYQTKIGKIGIAEKDGKITYLSLPGSNLPEEYEIYETPLLKEAYSQLKSYLDGKLKEFSLPLEPSGTEFMKKVWKELLKIPYGKTSTYKEIAQKVNSPKAVRAVGQANHRNPIPIFIPCHRVIGSDGSLTGFGGGLELKQQLLDLERIK